MKQGGRTKKYFGQSLIEFALVLPIIALLIFGAMDIGRIVTTKIVMTNAAREGANYLSRRAYLKVENESGELELNLPKREEEARDVIVDYCANQRVEDINIFIPEDPDDGSCCTAGSPVSITVSKSVDLFYGDLLQFFGFLNDGTILVSTTVQMRVKSDET